LVETLFWESVKQFGLPIGLLLVGVVILSRVVVVQYRESRAQFLKQILELETERDLYRDKWLDALGAAEVGEEATKRLARSKRRGS
jgi:NAD-dependent DNA ligase